MGVVPVEAQEDVLGPAVVRSEATAKAKGPGKKPPREAWSFQPPLTWLCRPTRAVTRSMSARLAARSVLRDAGGNGRDRDRGRARGWRE